MGTYSFLGLADGFLGIAVNAAVVLFALGAGPVRKLLFLAIRADGQRARSQKVVRAAKCGAAR